MNATSVPSARWGAPVDAGCVRLFLCGDVMTGRGIDQVLPHPCRPNLFESWVRFATGYVELAERASGRIGRALAFAYPWGEALAVLEQMQPHARIVNLETAVTTSEDAQPGKGIHYRMNPLNLPCLTGAGIDCCVLANNHVLDWGVAGLEQTLTSLRAAGIGTAGAGRNRMQAATPAVIELAPPRGRVLVFAVADASSGVPRSWAASDSRSGVNLLQSLSEKTAQAFCRQAAQYRRPGDVVVASVHWGGNWGFEIPSQQRAFAHTLVDGGGADIVHGHSSHHVKGIEVRHDKLILYGCGDFLNDYEGIGGHGEFRPGLSLMYFPELDAAGDLRSLRAVPMRTRCFRLERATEGDASWLRETLDRECRPLGSRVTALGDGTLRLHWGE